MTIREMREKRANLLSQARALVDLVDREKREMNQEELNQYNTLIGQVTSQGEEIQRREQLEELERQAGQPMGEPTRPQPEQREQAARSEFGMARAAELRSRPEYLQAYRQYLQGGVTALGPNEIRALSAGNNELGGYLLAPMDMVSGLIQAVDNAVYVRQWATVYRVSNSADGLGAPSLDADPAAPAWTSELAIGTEDSTMDFGKRELHPHPLAKYIKVSRKLLRKIPSVDGLVVDRLAYKFGVTLEAAYMTGTGANQPLGVFTASSDGISTGRDYSTGNTTGEIRFDGLIGAKYTLKQSYWPRAKWLFHRDAMAQIAKLKDGSGAYMWRESVRAGEPDRVLGVPAFMSEYAPNTFSTQQYVGIIGDFSYYWIADDLDMEIQRLVELYAGTNQVGLIGRMETDGMPVLEEAFVRVKLA